MEHVASISGYFVTIRNCFKLNFLFLIILCFFIISGCHSSFCTFFGCCSSPCVSDLQYLTISAYLYLYYILFEFIHISCQFQINLSISDDSFYVGFVNSDRFCSRFSFFAPLLSRFRSLFGWRDVSFGHPAEFR